MQRVRMSKSSLPPMGVYVPAVVWFDANDELDETAIKAHVLRLAQVRHSRYTENNTEHRSRCREASQASWFTGDPGKH